MFCRTTAGLAGAPATAMVLAAAEFDVVAIAIGVPIGVVVLASIAGLLIWRDRSGRIGSSRRRRRRD
ncbi:hypothetical protein [Salinibacterium sp. ZJ450]|uniref:hypothetical protein n=1 Tax=Salinibacterium sp. ZJ450 TaxID=2708338 RepID=UPI001421AF93|nr:hypothetical protein [Salinibacterium sp. ZJ450]